MSPSPFASPTSRSRDAVSSLPILAGVVFVMIYTLAIGWGLLARSISPHNTFALMIVPAILPALWYGTVFLRDNANDKGDKGLLLSALGWVLVALALGFQHLAVAAALIQTNGILAETPQSTPAFVAALMGVVCLAAGAAISLSNAKSKGSMQ